MGRVVLCLLVMFLISDMYATSDELLLSDEVSQLDSLEGKKLIEEVIFLFDSLEKFTNQSYKIELTNRIFNITKEKNELAHVISLVYKVRYSEASNPSIYDSAFEIAERNNNNELMMLVQERRSRYYIDHGRYDKAIIYILNLLEMTQVSGDDEAYRNTLNLLADIYFSAELFDQAKLEYHKLLKYYCDNDLLGYWRPYVIMNDLGQMELLDGNEVEALAWYKKSLSLADSNLFMSCRENTMAYTRLQIAEVYIKMGEEREALEYITKVEAVPDSYIYEDVQQELVFLQATYLYVTHDFNEALNYANKLVPSKSSLYNEYCFVPDVYKLIAEIYSEKNEHGKAMEFMQKYTHINDSLVKQNNIARSMILLTESQHQKTKSDLQKEKKLSGNLILTLVSLFLVLLIIMLLYRRLYKSKLRLIKKSLDNSAFKDVFPVKSAGSEKEVVNDDEAIRQLKLIINLNDLFIEKRVFLNSSLNINETAELLSSNRTYLSKAINTQLQCTFPAFINEYRVKESINLITSGFATNHTIEALAKKSGFANRNVFVSAFKKSTGVVPSFFIAHYKKLDGILDIKDIDV